MKALATHESSAKNRQLHAPPSNEQLLRAAGLLQEALAILEARGLSAVPLSGPVTADRLLRLPEVERLTGLSRSTIYDQMQKGMFPRSIKVGPRAATWSQSSIQAWIAARLEGRPM